MHPVLFSVKRAYWSANLRMIELTKPFGLTPARTDLMRIVAIHGDAGVPQWKLVRLLGCCASVVSRMLGSLEDLEFVDRTGDRRDPRKKIVHLTQEGWIRLSKVMRLLVDKNEVGLRVHQAYGGSDGWRKRGGLFERLNGVRRVFWDRSPFLHPWRREHVIDEEKDSPIHPKQRLQLDDFDDSRPDEEVLREITVKFAAKPMTKNFFEAHGCLKIFRDHDTTRRSRDRSDARRVVDAPRAPGAPVDGSGVVAAGGNASSTAPEEPPSEGSLQRWAAYVEQLEPGAPIPSVEAFRCPPASPPASSSTGIDEGDGTADASDSAPKDAPSEGTLQRWTAHVEQLEPGASLPSIDAFRGPPPPPSSSTLG